MLDIDKVRQALVLADKLVDEYSFPDWEGTDCAMRALTDQGAALTLEGLCGKGVVLDELETYVSRRRLLDLIKTAETWINVYAKGQEMHQVLTTENQLTAQETIQRYRELIEVFERCGLVDIVSTTKDGHAQYAINLANCA